MYTTAAKLWQSFKKKTQSIKFDVSASAEIDSGTSQPDKILIKVLKCGKVKESISLMTATKMFALFH